MQDNNEHIDSVFRSKFDGFKIEPDPAVWNSIEASLKKKKRGVLILWMKRSGIAAAILLAFSTGWYFANNSVNKATIEMAEIPTNTMLPLQYSESIKSNLRVNRSVFNKIKNQQLENSLLADERNSQNKMFLQKLPSRSVGLPLVMHRLPKVIAMNDEGFSASDRAIIAMNLELLEEKKSSKSLEGAWILGAGVAPSYTFDMAFNSSNNNFEYAPLEVSNSSIPTKNYETTLAGVVHVAFETQKRFKIETGIGYRKLAQELGNVDVASANQMLSVTGDYLATELKNLSTNSVNMRTDIGVASINLPYGTQIANTQTTIYSVSKSASVYEEYQMAYRTGYIEVPLNMYYKIVDKKIDVSAIAGINTNFLVSNVVTLRNGLTGYKGGTIDGLNTLTFSSNVGVGIEYDLARKIKFSIEPIMKIQMSSLNSNSQFDARPFNLGIYSGLRYIF